MPLNLLLIFFFYYLLTVKQVVQNEILSCEITKAKFLKDNPALLNQKSDEDFSKTLDQVFYSIDNTCKSNISFTWSNFKSKSLLN